MIYIVNELCELEQESYNVCHGAYTDMDEAYAKAIEIYNQAKIDLGEDAEYCDEEMTVWSYPNAISVEINSAQLNISEQHSKEIAAHIIDIFECELESQDITLPDEERTGEPTEARIFGKTYYHFEDSIIEELDRI